MQAAIKRLKHAQWLLIPASTETRGHATELNAAFYAQQLGVFMKETAQH